MAATVEPAGRCARRRLAFRRSSGGGRSTGHQHVLIAFAAVDTESKRKASALARLAEVQAGLDRLGAERIALVARCVRWEATWTEVATALGVSAQAAHRRFRHARYDPSATSSATLMTVPASATITPNATHTTDATG